MNGNALTGISRPVFGLEHCEVVMEQDMPHGLSKYSKYWLVLLAFAGAALVYLPMTRHGAGLSPDSVGYIGTARNLARGLGFTNYDNTPMVT